MIYACVSVPAGSESDPGPPAGVIGQKNWHKSSERKESPSKSYLQILLSYGLSGPSRAAQAQCPGPLEGPAIRKPTYCHAQAAGSPGHGVLFMECFKIDDCPEDSSLSSPTRIILISRIHDTPGPARGWGRAISVRSAAGKARLSLRVSAAIITQ